ncbi:MAG: class I SAM-dependent methyltransferase [Saprospiraceae bacterium]|nr:class I SAM-dependent methyltransferase [Saprospiraceae bacterium]
MVEFTEILKCPNSEESLHYISDQIEVNSYLGEWDLPFFRAFGVSAGFINESRSWFYPIVDQIILLHPYYGIPQYNSDHSLFKDTFDKRRVFDYYNNIGYISYNDHSIYADSSKWLDYRQVSKDYIESSLSRARQYLPDKGQYLLDAGSGPIGLQQYLDLSKGYTCRICCDISFSALQQAQRNLTGPGLFICCDILNTPIIDNICDAVISQHVIYHIPRKQQKRAIEELYRITKPGGTTAIVYSFFYHSILMDATLFPVQLYRIIRHFLGKLFVKLIDSKPRLYFYSHGRKFFKNFYFSEHLKIYTWRSLNSYFLRLYIHEAFMGKRILNFFKSLEERYPEFMGTIGEYPIIVIDKPVSNAV